MHTLTLMAGGGCCGGGGVERARGQRGDAHHHRGFPQAPAVSPRISYCNPSMGSSKYTAHIFSEYPNSCDTQK